MTLPVAEATFEADFRLRLGKSARHTRVVQKMRVFLYPRTSGQKRGNVNLWRWIDAGRWPNPTASSVDASVRDDEDADDIHEDAEAIHARDVLAAAVDFDEWGTEIDDTTTGIHRDDDDQG